MIRQELPNIMLYLRMNEMYILRGRISSKNYAVRLKLLIFTATNVKYDIANSMPDALMFD